MIIAVTGFAGTGKDTLGKALARQLGIRHLCPTFKDLAVSEGMDLMAFQAKAAQDPGIDKKFDDFLKAEAAKGSCVATSWLSPWMLQADLRVYLFAPEAVRARRLAQRDRMPMAQALKHIRARDRQNRIRYKKVYGIDILDREIFDLGFNSDRFRPEQMADVVERVLRQRGLIKFD